MSSNNIQIVLSLWRRSASGRRTETSNSSDCAGRYRNLGIAGCITRRRDSLILTTNRIWLTLAGSRCGSWCENWESRYSGTYTRLGRRSPKFTAPLLLRPTVNPLCWVRDPRTAEANCVMPSGVVGARHLPATVEGQPRRRRGPALFLDVSLDRRRDSASSVVGRSFSRGPCCACPAPSG